MNKTDNQLKQDIEQELLSDPMVNSAQIAVSVDNGAVSLFGAVDTYPAKWAAEDATKRVHGVRAVAHDLTVKLAGDHLRTDPEVAAAVQHALEWDVFVPKNVTATVEDGLVTLEGEVPSNYQRQAAERAARFRRGVVSVENHITIKPQASPALVQERIRATLARRGTNDAQSLLVATVEGKVTLSGNVSHWQSVEHAVNAAWAIPGVTEVVNQVHLLPAL